jgi:hypothetical protein
MNTIPRYYPFQFQRDAIVAYSNILLKNNGVCIFDQTGLGKTITASTIALNHCQGKLLVIASRSNKSSWVEVLSETGLDFVICTSAKIIEDEYDMVIVDEAHNFRSAKSKSYLNLFQIIHQNQAKTLLLTATPIQNELQELKTMLSLIRFNVNTPAFILLGNQFQKLFEIEKKMEKLKFKSSDYRPFMEEVDENFSFRDIGNSVEYEHQFRNEFAILCQIIFTFSGQCTRDMIKLLYSEDMALMGRFPNKVYQNIEYPAYSRTLQHLYETLKIIDTLKFPVHNLRKEGEKMPFNGLMKSLLLKRLDSSVAAFKASINALIFKLPSNPFSFMAKAIYEGYNVPDSIIEDIQSEYEKLKSIAVLWLYKNDADKFNEVINHWEPGKKVVVFTEYIETLNAFREHLHLTPDKAGYYSSESPEIQLDLIADTFDANRPYVENVHPDILITTDILAEGVNLHRADIIIHLDQKWNPSRTIQRNGRVDRLFKEKVENKTIKVLTFRTNALVEPILKLEKIINHKQFLADEFWENLKPLYVVPFEFNNQEVFFFPDEKHFEHFCLIDTVIGPIPVKNELPKVWTTILDSKNYLGLSNKNYVKLSKTNSEHLIPGARHIPVNALVFKNYLYNQTFMLILDTKVKAETDKTTYKALLDTIIDVFKLDIPKEDYPKYCSIWLKKMRYLNWEEYLP